MSLPAEDDPTAAPNGEGETGPESRERAADADVDAEKKPQPVERDVIACDNPAQSTVTRTRPQAHLPVPSPSTESLNSDVVIDEKASVGTLDTVEEKASDPIAVLHQGAAEAEAIQPQAEGESSRPSSPSPPSSAPPEPSSQTQIEPQAQSQSSAPSSSPSPPPTIAPTIPPTPSSPPSASTSPPLTPSSLPPQTSTSARSPPTSQPITPSSRPTSPRLLRANMPPMVDLSDLILHSPSSHIVGTPFATNTTKFEYPFPDTSASASSSGLGQSPVGSTGSMSGSSSFSARSLSSTVPSPMMHPLPPPLIAPGGGFMSTSPSVPVFSLLSSPELSGSSHAPTTYSSANSSSSTMPTHPKLKAQAANPPVPPSLQKKRPKWSLSLLGRRKSSGGVSAKSGLSSPDSEGSVDSVVGKMGSPLGSPQEEQGKA